MTHRTNAFNECAICMERAECVRIQGCNHAFCLSCIASWCTRYKATCPTCRGCIYGLDHGENEVFLSPHTHPTFGMQLEEGQVGGANMMLLVTHVDTNSAASSANIYPRDLIQVIRPDGAPASNTKEATLIATVAREKGRMLRIRRMQLLSERMDGNENVSAHVAQCIPSCRWFLRKVGVFFDASISPGGRH